MRNWFSTTTKRRPIRKKLKTLKPSEKDALGRIISEYQRFYEGFDRDGEWYHFMANINAIDRMQEELKKLRHIDFDFRKGVLEGNMDFSWRDTQKDRFKDFLLELSVIYDIDLDALIEKYKLEKYL